MLKLNSEELTVLAMVKELEDQGKKKASFYSVAEALDADTNRLIPIAERLKEDEYVTSNGIIYHYFHMTEKGLAALTE